MAYFVRKSMSIYCLVTFPWSNIPQIVNWKTSKSVSPSAIRHAQAVIDGWRKLKTVYLFVCEVDLEILMLFVRSDVAMLKKIKWLSDQVTEWPSDRVTKWPSDRVTEWPSDLVIEWLSDRVTEWPNYWVTGWQEASQMIDPMVYFIIVFLSAKQFFGGWICYK